MMAAYVLDAMPMNAAFQSAKTRSYAQHMQLLPSLAYSLDMSPIEHVWDLVGRHPARVPPPAASKDELLLRFQAI
ncbi:hypothetical protein TNCV_2788501 [Trichonephila clavipes]|uniref:Uncharacterized protein n=1 Tax=Trichonephila clavipes TaxID=2585209 RepID=A0A8X6T1M5_TRICX|nr:hypothetical protein TNCV_2788501 [Trichonephila clavipes]